MTLLKYFFAGRRLRFNRQRNGKDGSLSPRAFNFNLAPMAGHNILTCGQSQTRALFFGAEEGVKYLYQILFRDASSGILNLYDESALFFFRGNRQDAAGPHGLNRVGY